MHTHTGGEQHHKEKTKNEHRRNDRKKTHATHTRTKKSTESNTKKIQMVINLKIGVRTGKQIFEEINEYSDSQGNHEWDTTVFIPLCEVDKVFPESIETWCPRCHHKTLNYNPYTDVWSCKCGCEYR
jgi:hypothetical protein